ncbi:DUF2971 domain-containing protein [Pseudoalteromonas agarivorans]|uniref:DUF2971 domain-containing protein n=1 Tax=Pseudoalteromonas agarivorans TaxID=176102 RepID=UPI0003F7F762|nr:DUF2971 domain-containing protein [Pseudoalteromonas agarivorans]
MNLKKIKQLRKTHSLEKFELVDCERNITGLNTHYNVSVRLGDSVTNFNILANATDTVLYVERWADEVSLVRTERFEEISKNVFQPFTNGETLDDDTVIWKYMDLSKFISLLSSQSLWFARLDKNWEVDPFEGKVPTAHWESLVERILNTKFAPQFFGKSKVQFGGMPEVGMAQVPQSEQKSREIDLQRNMYEAAIYNSYVTCWNISTHESYHMWKLYCNHHNGIAIKSTIGRLKSSLGKNKNYTVLGGLIEYLDFKNQMPARGDNLLTHIYCKSMPYSFENEFRLCLRDFGFVNDVIGGDAPYSVDPEEIRANLDSYRSGYTVKLDLNTLIESVVTSPHSDPWFFDLVTSIVGDGREFPNSLSDLNAISVTSSNMN